MEICICECKTLLTLMTWYGMLSDADNAVLILGLFVQAKFNMPSYLECQFSGNNSALTTEVQNKYKKFSTLTSTITAQQSKPNIHVIQAVVEYQCNCNVIDGFCIAQRHFQLKIQIVVPAVIVAVNFIRLLKNVHNNNHHRCKLIHGIDSRTDKMHRANANIMCGWCHCDFPRSVPLLWAHAIFFGQCDWTLGLCSMPVKHQLPTTWWHQTVQCTLNCKQVCI